MGNNQLLIQPKIENLSDNELALEEQSDFEDKIKEI